MCRRQKREKFLMSRAFTVENILKISNWSYCQTQKTVNTWKISGMLIAYWRITIKFRIRKQTSEAQTNYCCCLWLSYLAPYWLISCNTITFHKYFWCSRFCEFHSERDIWVWLENWFLFSWRLEFVVWKSDVEIGIWKSEFVFKNQSLIVGVWFQELQFENRR